MFCVHIQHYLWKVGSSAIQQLTGQQSHFLLLIPGDNLLYCHWYLGQICRDFIENRSRVFLQDIALDDQWSAASLLLKSTWISQQLTSHKFSVVKQLSSLQYRHLSAKPNIPGMQKGSKPLQWRYKLLGQLFLNVRIIFYFVPDVRHDNTPLLFWRISWWCKQNKKWETSFILWWGKKS